MIRSLTIRCDWPSCHAELTFEFHTLRPDAPGWKVEGDSPYSLHLCPEHSRKAWNAVRLAQFEDGEAPSTGR
jgi:hypothetical protein